MIQDNRQFFFLVIWQAKIGFRKKTKTFYAKICKYIYFFVFKTYFELFKFNFRGGGGSNSFSFALKKKLKFSFLNIKISKILEVMKVSKKSKLTFNKNSEFFYPDFVFSRKQ